MLSSEEFAQARATQELLMTSTALIRRSTTSNDGMGGTLKVWADSGTVPCRYSAGSASDATLLAGKLQEVAPWRVVVPALTDVRNEDRIIVNGTYTFEVVGISAPSTLETARVCMCTEVTE